MVTKVPSPRLLAYSLTLAWLAAAGCNRSSTVAGSGPGGEAPGQVTQVIPPGQESHVSRMLGAGEQTAGCTFTGARIDRTVIQASFQCGGAPVVATLGHRSQSEPQDGTTTLFFVRSDRGDLRSALTDRVRANESGFQFKGVSPPPPRAAAPENRPGLRGAGDDAQGGFPWKKIARYAVLAALAYAVYRWITAPEGDDAKPAAPSPAPSPTPPASAPASAEPAPPAEPEPQPSAAQGIAAAQADAPEETTPKDEPPAEPPPTTPDDNTPPAA